MFYIIYYDYFVTFGCIVPIIFGLLNYRHFEPAHKIIFAFLIFTLLGNSINTILAHLYISNWFMFHIYICFEFAFVSFYFSKLLNGRVAKITPYLVGVFAVICIINFFYFQNESLSTYTRSIESLVLVTYCLMFLNRQSQTENSYRWKELSYNWITVGLMVFYSCSLFTFMFTNYFINADKFTNQIVWGTYGAFIIIENILFAIAFNKCRTHQITLSR